MSTWIYIIVAVVIIGLIIWLATRKKKGDGEPQPPADEPPMSPPSTPPGV